MPQIQCFWIEPTKQAQRSLRRYCSVANGSAPCPTTGWYHNARVQIENGEIAEIIAGVYHLVAAHAEWDKNDPRWPSQCVCGYVFQATDEWQLFTERLYRRVDNGELMTIANAPPGAMWDAEWWRDAQGRGAGPDGLSLYVKLPGNRDWFIDGPASNCTKPDEKHNCWVREGTPPNINIIPGANICGVGAGSILAGEYHGFLRNGVLVD